MKLHSIYFFQWFSSEITKSTVLIYYVDIYSCEQYAAKWHVDIYQKHVILSCKTCVSFKSSFYCLDTTYISWIFVLTSWTQRMLLKVKTFGMPFILKTDRLYIRWILPTIYLLFTWMNLSFRRTHSDVIFWTKGIRVLNGMNSSTQ